MRLKTVLITILVTFIVSAALNGVFHGLIMENYFNEAFTGFETKVNKMADSNPAWQIATELVWVSALFYLLTFRAQRISTKHAIIGGMLMNASVSGTWNFINASLFNVFPKEIILPDMAFHIVVVGTISGWLIAALYNKLEKK
ncbi:MAG TPA: DUF2177 family protein [Chitinophagaceae bacterium]|nr:DUF2177 family protein [Chitinophagaceae bacterium]